MAASSQPTVREHEEDENDSGSFCDKSLEAPPEPTERVMKYDYEEKTEKLGEFKLIKFKNGQSAVKEGLVLSIEKDKKTVSQLLYFILRNEMTKVSVFEGFLLPKTQLKSLGNECSWKLEVIRIKGKD